MEKNINLKISKNNLKILENIKNNSKIPITRIINILISKFNTNIDFLNNKIIDNEETVIKIKLTNNEKEFLKNEAEKSGSNTLTSEVKFRLLNTIYKNKYFTNNELIELSKNTYELNKIGVNINQILKKINKENNINNEELKNIINELKIKINDNNTTINEIVKFTKNRF